MAQNLAHVATLKNFSANAINKARQVPAADEAEFAKIVDDAKLELALLSYDPAATKQAAQTPAPAPTPTATAAPAATATPTPAHAATASAQPVHTIAQAAAATIPTRVGWQHFFPQINWGEWSMPNFNLSWLPALFSNRGIALVAILIAIPVLVQAFLPGWANQLEFGVVAGPKASGQWSWQATQLVNTVFYTNLLTNMSRATVAIQFVTVLQLLVSVSSALDALSNLTGRDWSGVVGQMLVLPALAAPTPLVQAAIMLAACWSMSRDRNARREGLHWLLIAVAIAMGLYIVGTNYKTMGTRGIEGLIKTIFVALNNLNAMGALVVSYAVILWFDWRALQFANDGSSQAWLHLLLATLALLSGSIPFAPEIKGQWQTVSWTAIQNPIWLYVNANLLIAIILFFQEQVKVTHHIAGKDGESPKKSFASHWAPVAVSVCYIGLQLWIGSLIKTVYNMSFLLSWLCGFFIVSLPLGIVLFAASMASPSFKQPMTSALNTLLGDHTMAGPILILNDQFNLVAACLMLLVLNVPQFAAMIGLV